jgi:hypothetical protein
LIKARDTTDGLVLTTSGGAIVCQSAENGNLVVPHDLLCSNMVSASSLEATSFVHNGTLLSTLLSQREEAFGATSPLQKVLNNDGSISLRLNPSADVVANAFSTGSFRLHSPDLNGVEIQYFDAGWQRMCKFFWDSGSPSLLVNTIKAAGADQVTCGDNLHVEGNLTVTGSAPSPYWAGCNFDESGSIFSQKGRFDMTVTKPGGDTYYTITFPSHPDGARYVCLHTSTEYHCLIRDQTSTSCTIYTRTHANVAGPTGNGNVSFVILM